MLLTSNRRITLAKNNQLYFIECWRTPVKGVLPTKNRKEIRHFLPIAKARGIRGGITMNILNSVLSHHEYFNGMGYPRNLVGENIPFKARIISVADALDAMVSLRTYKIAQSLDLALREINMCSGEQFDPYIAKTSGKWNKNILENTLYSPVIENILAL